MLWLRFVQHVGAHPTPPPVSPTVLTPLSIHGMVDEYLTFTPFRLLNSKKFPPLLTGLCLTLFTKMKKSVRGEGQGAGGGGEGMRRQGWETQEYREKRNNLHDYFTPLLLII